MLAFSRHVTACAFSSKFLEVSSVCSSLPSNELAKRNALMHRMLASTSACMPYVLIATCKTIKMEASTRHEQLTSLTS